MAGAAMLPMQALLVDFARVGRTVAQSEETLLNQMVEAVKCHLRTTCEELVRSEEYSDLPVLFNYSADATPLKLASHHVHTSDGETCSDNPFWNRISVPSRHPHGHSNGLFQSKTWEGM